MQLPRHGRAALLEAIKRFERDEHRASEIKKLVDCKGLWEVRVNVGNDPFRAVFFYDDTYYCICVTAVYKNQQELPKQVRDRATRRMRAWQAEQARRRKSEP
jgi:hypothetical protein